MTKTQDAADDVRSTVANTGAHASRAAAKAKDAAAAEIAKQKEAKAEDRVAARYYAESKAKGKQVNPPQLPATAPAAPAAKAAPAPAKK